MRIGALIAATVLEAHIRNESMFPDMDVYTGRFVIIPNNADHG